MNFGTFLLGVTEGLDSGVKAGDRISAAMDAKSVRDAAKKASGQKPVTTPGAAPSPLGLGPDVPQVPNSPMRPAGAPTGAAPPAGVQNPGFMAYNQSGQPAARLGVNANPYGGYAMPEGIQRRWGVTGDPSVLPY